LRIPRNHSIPEGKETGEIGWPIFCGKGEKRYKRKIRHHTPTLKPSTECSKGETIQGGARTTIKDATVHGRWEKNQREQLAHKSQERKGSLNLKGGASIYLEGLRAWTFGELLGEETVREVEETPHEKGALTPGPGHRPNETTPENGKNCLWAFGRGNVWLKRKPSGRAFGTSFSGAVRPSPKAKGSQPVRKKAYAMDGEGGFMGGGLRETGLFGQRKQEDDKKVAKHTRDNS